MTDELPDHIVEGFLNQDSSKDLLISKELFKVDDENYDEKKHGKKWAYQFEADTELKTLKDIFDKDNTNNGCCDCRGTYNTKQIEEILKAEAVKDIKFIRNNAKFQGIRLRASERDLLCYFIKWKFNLTEEDLQ